MPSTPNQAARADYELRFRSLFHPGRGLAFPCDATGKVDMDGMSRRALNNYLFARTLIGREFSVPEIGIVLH